MTPSSYSLLPPGYRHGNVPVPKPKAQAEYFDKAFHELSLPSRESTLLERAGREQFYHEPH